MAILKPEELKEKFDDPWIAPYEKVITMADGDIVELIEYHPCPSGSNWLLYQYQHSSELIIDAKRDGNKHTYLCKVGKKPIDLKASINAAGIEEVAIDEEAKEIEKEHAQALLDAQKAEEERLQREAELEAERLAEEERIAREKKAEEERLEKERLEKELRILNAINYYPEDLSDISIPHLYRPAKEFLVKDNHLTSLRLMLIPMGENALTAENIASIISSISDIKADFIALTGSRENQVAFAKAYNKDSITFEDGTIITSTDIPWKLNPFEGTSMFWRRAFCTE